MGIKDLLYYGLVLCSIFISLVVSYIATKKDKKSKRTKTIAENGVQSDKGSSKLFKEIVLDNLPKYMIMAESLYNGIVNPSIKKTGAQKLAFVLDKVKIDCLTNNIEYNEQEVTNKVEELVDLTKQVNSN